MEEKDEKIVVVVKVEGDLPIWALKSLRRVCGVSDLFFFVLLFEVIKFFLAFYFGTELFG